MRRLLSKESLADFAQQAAGALRRMVSSSDGWNSRDALSSSSQIVAAACKANARLEASILKAWVDDLVKELELQFITAKESAERPGSLAPASLHTNGIHDSAAASTGKAKDDVWKPLSESALMTNLEVARLLVFSVNAKEAGAAYHEKKLVHALLQYYRNPTLSQKLRDCCAFVVVGVCSSQNELLRDCLHVCKNTLRDSPEDYTGSVLRVLLASLLVEVLHQSHISGHRRVTDELDERSAAYCKSLIDTLFRAALQQQQTQQQASIPSLNGSVSSPTTFISLKNHTDAAKTAEAVTYSPTSPAVRSPPPASGDSEAALSPRIMSPPATLIVSASTTDATAPTVGEASGEGTSVETTLHSNLTFTASIVFLSVVGGVYRGKSELKAYFLRHYSADYTQLWTKLASQLPQMQTTLQLSLGPSRIVATATLEPVEYWRSELLESLVELCTEDSFSNQRAIAMTALGGGPTTATTSATLSTAAIPAHRVAQRGPGGSPTLAVGSYQYDPIPTEWEAYLSSSSPSVWQLASALYNCTITASGADVLKAVMLQLNTKHVAAETLYRWVICTLTLLCVANPRNAVLLSEHHMLRTLIALINCNQPSVFPSSAEVTLWACDEQSDEEDQKQTVASPSASSNLSSSSALVPASKQVKMVLTPLNALNVNTTQLTFCFLDTLTSTTFAKGAVDMLRNGIQAMYSVASSQTDVDVVEAVLYGLCRSFIPRPLLFFPGDGYVTWRLKQIFPRGSGYSFSAWIFPTCVWGGGSCLYSFMDQSDTRVSLLVVANGRLCSLAVRVNKAGGNPLELVLSDGVFTASQWTHVVVTQGVAFNVYINGRRLESVHEVPYPKEKHSLTFTMGGAAQLPGFFGFTSGMNISPTLSEKDIARLYTAGPSLYEPTKDCASVLAPCFEEETSGDTQSPSASSTLQQHEVLAKHSSELSWHNVELYTPTDVEEIIIPKRVLEWVLSVLKARETAALHSTSTFMNVAKLCISFLSTSMQLASNDDLTALVRKNYLERLRTEVLSWKTTFPEFASLLLQSVTVRGGGRVLRAHASTQCVFDILLGCVMQASARNKELMSCSGGSTYASNGSAMSPPPLPSISTPEANSTNIILRELSDCLLVKENLKLFQEDPKRFQSILNLTLHLPKECIKSVVILIEKLCRGEAELRQVFLFLFTPSSSSPTIDTAKVRVLRMLFDIAQEDVAMCEMIQECYKGRGFAFLLMLVNGENHSSEAIRVLAIGLLSLLMPLKSCAKFFKKNDGFDVLAMAITEPRNPISLGIRTFDALIQVAFDEFRRRKEKKPEADGIATRLMAAAHLSHRPRQRESSSSAATASAAAAIPPTAAAGLNAGRPPKRIFEYRGHTPTITVNQLGTRRGYSFEHTHDYGKVSEDFGELMILHKGSRYHSLELPLALKAVLCVLDFLIQNLVNRLPSLSSTSSSSNPRRMLSGEMPSATVSDYPVSPLPRPESGTVLGNTPLSSSINSDEKVVVEVLNYLSKVVDYPKHALKLMDIQWLGGLWVAVRVFFEKPPDSTEPNAATGPSFEDKDAPASASAASSAAAPDLFASGTRRLHQDRGDFVNEVRQRTCAIIRKMVILDISSNERAQVRSIRDGVYPPRLVRIVLEEVARYFCVQKNGELVENAGNVIRNLNSLFKDVQTAFHPFPPSLGVAIVMAITNISVSSSMQVRRRMKNSSNLLAIRDNLAFFVLRESRRFLRLRRRSLNQLIDINVNNTNSMTVLLSHLSNSIKENSVNEVEVLVLLIRQLAGSDSARLRELHNVVGENREVLELKELLSSTTVGGFSSTLSPLLPAAYPSFPTPSDFATSEPFTDLDSNAGGAVDRTHWNSAHGVGWNPLEDDSEPSAGAFTVQLLDWCEAHPEAWATVQKNIQSAMLNLGLDKKDEKKEERSTFFGGSSSGSGVGVGGLPSKVSNGGAAGVGYSERSRKEFQQLRSDVEEETAKSTVTSVATATPRGSGGH